MLSIPTGALVAPTGLPGRPFGEAPTDGQTYGRDGQQKSWVPVVDAADLTTALAGYVTTGSLASQLADYLPLTGGVISGTPGTDPLTINRSSTAGGEGVVFSLDGGSPLWRLDITHDNQHFGLYYIPTGAGMWIDQGANTWIDGALSVGRINGEVTFYNAGSTDPPLKINADAGHAGIDLQSAGVTLWRTGITATNDWFGIFNVGPAAAVAGSLYLGPLGDAQLMSTGACQVYLHPDHSIDVRGLCKFYNQGSTDVPLLINADVGHAGFELQAAGVSLWRLSTGGTDPGWFGLFGLATNSANGQIWIGPNITQLWGGGGSGVGLDVTPTGVTIPRDLTVGGTFTNPSDRRLKQNVVPWARGLDEIQQLEPVQFSPVSDPDRTRYGLMADDVEDVMPELVSCKGPENHQMLDVGSLTFVLINAVKELAGQVAELRAKNGG